MTDDVVFDVYFHDSKKNLHHGKVDNVSSIKGAIELTRHELTMDIVDFKDPILVLIKGGKN